MEMDGFSRGQESALGLGIKELLTGKEVGDGCSDIIVKALGRCISALGYDYLCFL